MYEWKQVTGSARPELLDTNSSKEYNYIRKDVEEVEKEMDDETYVSYTYLEKKIHKTEWEYYKSLTSLEENTNERVSDLENAICELTKLL